MNKYSVYGGNDNNDTCRVDVIAFDETDAKKRYRNAHKGFRVISVEEIGGGFDSSAEDERIGLEKIKEIVKLLGEDGYVGTALKGCIEDAYDNIKFDQACSMSDRYESEIKRRVGAEKRMSILEETVREPNESIKEKEDEIERLRSSLIPEDDSYTIYYIIGNYIYENEKCLKEAEADILRHCDNPESSEFKNARTRRNNYAEIIAQAKKAASRFDGENK